MAGIARDLLEKVKQVPPTEITPVVRSLCQFINPNAQPIRVAVEPSEGAEISECFGNVLQHAERHGGSIVYGWSIWLWPRVYVEAEHHAVWDDGNGRLIDVTPHLGGERAILFHPDPNRRFDHEGRKRLPNVRRSLGELCSAAEYMRAVDNLHHFWEASSDGDMIHIDKARLLPFADAAEQAKVAVLVELAMRTRPHEPCICGSGLKFRKCCRSMVNLGAD